jgi:hypothetical protein
MKGFKMLKRFLNSDKTTQFFSVDSDGCINNSVEGRNKVTRFVRDNVTSLLEGKNITLTDDLFNKKKFNGKGRVLVSNLLHNPDMGHFMQWQKIFKFTIEGNTLTVFKK